MKGLNILPVIRHIARDPRSQLTGKVHMKNTIDTGGIAQVFICPDGTFVFDRKAVAALRLHATELLIMLGTAIVMLVEPPAPKPASIAAPSGDLSLQQS